MIENKTKHAFETRNTHTCVAYTYAEREREREKNVASQIPL